MKTYKIIIYITIFSSFAFLKCTNFENNLDPKIISQELTYDSINRKSKLFNVDLETTIKYKINDTSAIDYNHFILIINKDKYPLVPIYDSKKFDELTNTFIIKYIAKTVFVSKTFKNDTLTRHILNSKIITVDGKYIEKEDFFELKSLILGYSPNDKGMKYE